MSLMNWECGLFMIALTRLKLLWSNLRGNKSGPELTDAYVENRFQAEGHSWIPFLILEAFHKNDRRCTEDPIVTCIYQTKSTTQTNI